MTTKVGVATFILKYENATYKLKEKYIENRKEQRLIRTYSIFLFLFLEDSCVQVSRDDRHASENYVSNRNL